MAKKVTKKVKREKKEIKLVEMFYCPDCGGLVSQVLHDSTDWVSTDKYLTPDGYWEYGDSDTYESDYNGAYCTDHSITKLTTIKVSEEIFKRMWPTLNSNQVFKCTPSILDEVSITTDEELLAHII